MNEYRRALMLIGVAVFAALVFLADLESPLGGVAWVLYIPVILAPVWLNNARQVVIISVACSVLVVLGVFVPHVDNALWRGLRNRGMGLIALWLTAFAGVILCRRSLRLAALEREILEATNREQRRIGQELHDGVGQVLTGLGLMANALAQRLQDTAPEKRIAERLVTGLDRVHQQVRALSRGLVPVQVEAEGLCAALEDLAACATEESGIPVTLECQGTIAAPIQAEATELFRIAQEAVSNALRHGQPRHVRLTLAAAPEGLRLEIQDDGTGILNRPGEHKGMGLRIMKFRAEQIGGTLHLGPAEGGGTLVRCLLPLRKGEHHEEPRRDFALAENLDRG